MISVESAIRDAIAPAISAQNLFLEALHVATAGKHRIIRILVDGEKPLSLDEVTAITKPISEILDSVTELGERRESTFRSRCRAIGVRIKGVSWHLLQMVKRGYLVASLNQPIALSLLSRKKVARVNSPSKI